MADSDPAPAQNSTGQSFVVDITRPAEQGFDSYPTENAGGGEGNDQDPAGTEAAPKKKKKKKSKGKKKAAQPSGFEENYADAPMTPAEHEEETKDLYHPSRTFAERIETCIQRYRAKRKFDSHRKDIFDKYLSLGGVDTGPKMFSGGVDQSTLSDLNAGEIATLTATDSIGREKDMSGKEGSAWAVDFEAVAKCFFSSRVPIYFDFDTAEQINSCVAIIRNFLNYILYHGVCPEHTEQVHSARSICDLAERELFCVKKVSMLVPGDFNMACSTLYEGYYQGLYSGASSWAQESDITVGMSDAQATKVFRAGLAAHGTDEQAQHVKDGKPVHTIRTIQTGLEITAIEPPDDETRSLYRDGLGGKMKPLGKIRARRWVKPYAAPEDITDDEDDNNNSHNNNNNKADDTEFEFWIEDNNNKEDDGEGEGLLQYFFIGLKMEATIQELNIGITFFDAVIAVYCSFYTNLVNEMMLGWKEPVPVFASSSGGGDGEDGMGGEDDGDGDGDEHVGGRGEEEEEEEEEEKDYGGVAFGC